MAKPRLELQSMLEGILGSRNVYFQSPESVKLKYPCIVYKRSDMRVDSADNIDYRDYNRYTITVIDKNPDSLIPAKIRALKYCSFDNHSTVDNLNHDYFSIFF